MARDELPEKEDFIPSALQRIRTSAYPDGDAGREIIPKEPS
jgi:hypothetical protein